MINIQKEEESLVPVEEQPKQSNGVSRLVLNETQKQLQNSQQRIAELKQRLEEIKKQKEKSSMEDTSASIDEMKAKVASLQQEETKVLRRLYLLIKDIKGSIKSECLSLVADVISQNATVCINPETVERLLPFSQENIVKLLKEYISE